MTTLAVWVFGWCLVRGPATGSSLLTYFLQGSCLTQPLTQESDCLSPRGSAILLGTALQGTGEWAGAQGFAEVSWRQKMPGGRGRDSYTGPGWGHLSVCVCEIYGREPCKLSHTLKSWEGRCKVQMLLKGEGREIWENKEQRESYSGTCWGMHSPVALWTSKTKQESMPTIHLSWFAKKCNLFLGIHSEWLRM